MRSAITITCVRANRSAIGPAIVSPTSVEVPPSTTNNKAIERTSELPWKVAVSVTATASVYAQSPRFEMICALHSRMKR